MDSLRQQIALQIAWGADEVLLDAPQDRRQRAKAAAVAEMPADSTPARPHPSARPAARLALGAGPAGPADALRIAAGCDTLDALKAALNHFSGCALRDTATHLVFADGAEQTRLMLIGDAPGAEEDRLGRSFAGPAGQLLDKMLASIGLNRTQVRMADMVPWRPPGDRAPTESEIAICLPFLQRHIALVQPACLLLLGAVAAKAMLPAAVRNNGIRRLRGGWHGIDIPGLEAPIACLPTYHPAYLLRMASAKREAWRDLIALRERLNPA